MPLNAKLLNDVVLDGGRTLVRVTGSGFGRLRAGDVSTWVFGSFDRTMSVAVARRIDVRLGFARVTLTPNVVANVDVPSVRAIDVPVPTPIVPVPRPHFRIFVRLYEYVLPDPISVQRDRGEM